MSTYSMGVVSCVEAEFQLGLVMTSTFIISY